MIRPAYVPPTLTPLSEPPRLTTDDADGLTESLERGIRDHAAILTALIADAHDRGRRAERLAVTGDPVWALNVLDEALAGLSEETLLLAHRLRASVLDDLATAARNLDVDTRRDRA